MSGIPAVFEGFLFGAGLFCAMGPKDSFVIRQALVGRHLPVVIFICVASDIVLISLGVAGLGRLVSASATLLALSAWGGAGYLIWYGGKTLAAALNNTSMPAQEEGGNVSLRSLTITALMLSLFNPYALIDTVLVIGSISGSKPAELRWAFAGGAMVASWLWFSVLAAGTCCFRSWFEHATMWRLLDTGIALLMFYLAAHLILFY